MNQCNICLNKLDRVWHRLSYALLMYPHVLEEISVRLYHSTILILV